MDAVLDTVSADRLAAAERFVSDWVSNDRVPGATVSVFDPSNATAAGFGARQLERNEPATPDTLAGIGSCTKSFTGVAVLQLAAAGELSVTDAVDRYIDLYADAPGAPVTIRELLTHSSGFPSDGTATALISRLMGLDPVAVPLSDERQFHRHVAGAHDDRVTDREPFFYYNSGYAALGEIISRVSGQSYASYIADNVLEPLDMSRSTFEQNAFDAATDTMTPYYTDDGTPVEGSFPFDERLYAAGGLVSSVRELARYGQLQLNDGVFDGTRVLPADKIEESRTPVSQREQLVDGTSQEYAYGWMVRSFLDDTLVSHGGSIGVHNAFVGYLDEAELGVAVQCTTTPESHPMHVGPAVLGILRGAEPTVVPHFSLKRDIAELTGRYRSYRGIMEFTVEQMGGGLRLATETDRLGSVELPLVPTERGDSVWSFETVEASGAKTPVRFERTDDGIDLYYQRWRLQKADS